MRRTVAAVAPLVSAVVALSPPAPALAGDGAITTERIAVAPRGGQVLLPSGGPALSTDGRFVAFHSAAARLVPGDTNHKEDVLVRDRRRGRTVRVSLGPGGAQGDGDSDFPAISADGRYVAFGSEATNLVSGDTNGWDDVFVHDRRTGETTRLNLGPGGAQAADGLSFLGGISADGRFVAFTSGATNLVPGDTNDVWDVFVRDREAGTTARVSVGPGGVQADDHSLSATISGDGRFVVFQSSAGNLVAGEGGIDPEGLRDIFVFDRRTGRTERVSGGPGGVQGDSEAFAPSISADGRLAVFTSYSTNLVPGDTNGLPDVFVFDRRTRRTSRVNVGPGGRQADGFGFSTFSAISADGRHVTFESLATNLVPGDTNEKIDVFVHDRQTGGTERLSLGPGDGEANDDSNYPVISPDGRVVAFESRATDLVPRDTNKAWEVFARAR